MNPPPGRSRRGLVGLLLADGISLTGTRVSVVALPWFVLVTTGSATRTGLVAFAEMLPYVLVQALAGPVVDRLGPRPVSITGDAVGALMVGAVPLLHLLGLLPFPALLGLVALLGAARGPSDSAKSTLVPAVAEQAGAPLERVTGLVDGVGRTAGTVGPGVAGLLIAVTDPLTGLVLDAASFAVAAVLVSLLVPGADRRPAGGGVAGYLAELREGAAFLRQDRLLRGLMAMITVTNLLDQAKIVVLLPVWAVANDYGAGAIGLVLVATGLGAIGGAAVAAAVGHRLPRRTAYLVAFIIAGAPRFVVLAFGLPLVVVLAVTLVSGAFAGVINPVLSAIQIERIPRPLLGRVGALGNAFAWAGIPFGGPVAAAALAVVSLPVTLLGAGGLYLVATLTPALRPWGRQMDRVPATEAGTASTGAIGATGTTATETGVGATAAGAGPSAGPIPTGPAAPAPAADDRGVVDKMGA